MTEDERKVRHLLIEMSREGPVESWLTRMALLIVGSDIDSANINWTETPNLVAHAIAMEARRQCIVDKLLKLLQQRQAEGAF